MTKLVSNLSLWHKINHRIFKTMSLNSQKLLVQDSWNFLNRKLILLQISNTYIRKLIYLDPL